MAATRKTLAGAALGALLLLCPAPLCADGLEIYTPADTSSPRATLKSFIDSCNELHARLIEDKHFDRNSAEHRPLAMRVLDCIDMSGLPEFDREISASEAAICIKEVLDRFELPPYSEAPDYDDVVASAAGEGLRRWRIPGTRITIARVEEGPQRHEYLLSAGTVERSRQLYQEVRGLPYRTTGPPVTRGFHEWYTDTPANATIAALINSLPAWLKHYLLGQALWKWVSVIAIVLGGLLIMLGLYWLHGRLASDQQHRLIRYWLTLLPPIAAAFVPLLVSRLCYTTVTLRGEALYVISFTCNLLTFLALVFVVIGLSNRLAELIIASPNINPQGLDAQFVRIMMRLLGLGAAVVVLLQGGQYLGIPIATLIASAGIGGLALALAAQDALKNLFGTIMLLTDKPFRVGERIVVGKYDGVVEEIGLRSTRLRLLNGHQASIPNDELARSDIENVGRRPHIRRVLEFRLPLEASHDQVAAAIRIVREALADHEGMTPDFPPRVHLMEPTETAHLVKALYWYEPADYWACLENGEQITLGILAAFETEGVRLAEPLRVKQVDSE